MKHDLLFFMGQQKRPTLYQRQAVPRDVRRRLGLPNSKRISVSWVKRMIGVRS